MWLSGMTSHTSERNWAPFVGFAIDRYLINAVVNFWHLASILAVIVDVKPVAVHESLSVASSSFLCSLSPASTNSCYMITKSPLQNRVASHDYSVANLCQCKY